jgi:uncharacterized alpha-E superfamily protein
LLSLSGFELHLKTYRSANHNKNVLHQVILNEDFPRSVLYSLNRIEKYLEDVISENRSDNSADLRRYFGKLHNEIKYVDFENLNKQELEHCLRNIRVNMTEFNRYLTRNYFSYL